MKLPPLIYVKYNQHNTETYLVLLPEFNKVNNKDSKVYRVEYQKGIRDTEWHYYDLDHGATYSYNAIYSTLDLDFRGIVINDILDPVAHIPYLCIHF